MHTVSTSLREILTDAQIDVSAWFAYENSRNMAYYRSCERLESWREAWRASLMLAAARESTIEE